ncbi:ATP-binding protein [Flavobacterium columnare]|uniref:ATP-binding protein n=1 Tax=Flavobacterium columnare TaxID=996 RepID=A0AAI8CE88_9FLAO|nr:ATP-binding protein [Flavobacterium columnare]AMO19439.1 ATP-binding protein [Flavobacterium columnare]AUX17379.1 AAA family ATPase [Flavobacterium columnare]QOG56403.1 ATP-binding protein [Flavobacterium columnare]QOG59128.1 ATP-binding protein [Flavobacterium columnare]QOG61848.1 ATP-binding protein [Flavobacterium columnare]
MLTTEIKTKIIEKMLIHRENYASDVKHSRVLGIDNAQYSRIKKGELTKVIAETKWISLARVLQVQIGNDQLWQTAQTETYNYITAQLEACQNQSISAIFCDRAGIGKTHTAKVYVKKNVNAIYIDCSQYKSKQKLIRKMAQEFGVEYKGRYADVYEDLVFYIPTLTNPLIILDEAGDLDYPAFLELKALWNATEDLCGWYAMGADGLKAKIERQKDLKKVGYAEIFDRYNNGYKSVTPTNPAELKDFNMQQIALVSKVNNSSMTPSQMYAKSLGSLRKVKNEIKKQYLLSE